ncbi:MAG: hypothetical protein R3B49_10505 [Phycisphaerales bacterium]
MMCSGTCRCTRTRCSRSSCRRTAAALHRGDEHTEQARLFWFTVEFGLIREDGRLKIYGSGLASSHGSRSTR